jgi:peptidyl-dipeptidase A
MGTAEELVAACDERLRPLEIAVNRAWWEAQTNATEETERQRAVAEVALSDALADASAYAAIVDTLEHPGLDPLVRRTLTVLEESYAPHQVEPGLRRQIIDLQTSIETRFARHRAIIDGETVDDNAIIAILRGSDDTAERRVAWEASKTVGAEVAADVRELARLRNDAARRLGYRDHFAMALATTDYDEKRLFQTLDEVDALTAEPFRAMKRGLDERLAARFGVDPAGIGPWHYDDPFFQDVPVAVGVDLDPFLAPLDANELTARTFGGMGLAVDDVLARSDLLPRNGKVQHAFCLDVDRSGDVRVLANVVPGERWTETMLHEFGHAVYFTGVDRELPWLLRTMHLCVTEGVAMRCGRLVQQPDWLRDVSGVSADTVESLAPGLAGARRVALLVFARWVLVMTHFEHALYANPDGDHDTHWWDLVERYQLVRRPAGRNAPDWASKIHIAAAPVYYHNYLYGEMIASQLTNTFGSLVAQPDAGAALAARVFAPGASLRWDHLVERATGAPLSPAVLARELAN